MTIYIDVLFAVNFYINLLIILSVGFLLRFRTAFIRPVIGAAVSALYSVLMFFPPVRILYTVVGRIAFTVLFVTVYYKKYTLRSAVNAVLAFFVVSFIFLGLIYAYSSSLGSGSVLVSNGIVYADISIIKLLVSAGVSWIAAEGFIKLSDKYMSRRRIIYDAEIVVRGAAQSVKILCDTGCELTEPLSGLPVILISGKLKPEDFDESNCIRYAGIKTAMNRYSKTVPLAKPDKVFVKNCDIEVCSCYIGFADGLRCDGVYNAIASPEVFSEINSVNKIDFRRRIKQMIEDRNNNKNKIINKLLSFPQSIVKILLKHLAKLTAGGAHYIGGADTLPAPYSKEEEGYWIGELANPENSENAARKLTEHNLRLVVYIAKKFDSTGIGIEDLISIGTIGLIKAINTFKPEKNIKLATYASRCIENEILMYLRKNSNGKNEVSIDEPLNVDWDGNELLLSDILGTDSDVTQKNLEDETDKKLLKLAMDKLTGRERNIVELRFGINNHGEEKTQKEVADILGISQSYISRLEKRIIGRLRCDINRMING